MPTKIGAPKRSYSDIMVQEDKRPWWEKYESNAEKAQNAMNISFTVDDLKFLKEFGDINISIAGIFAVTKILKR